MRCFPALVRGGQLLIPNDKQTPNKEEILGGLMNNCCFPVSGGKTSFSSKIKTDYQMLTIIFSLIANCFKRENSQIS